MSVSSRLSVRAVVKRGLIRPKWKLSELTAELSFRRLLRRVPRLFDYRRRIAGRFRRAKRRSRVRFWIFVC
jgi:hypothetical protein